MRLPSFVLLFVLLAPCSVAQFVEGFEDYALNSVIEGQGGWDNGLCSPTFTSRVSDDVAHSGSQSLELVFGPGPSGNPTDLVNDLGGVPITGGRWTVTAYVYVPSVFTGESWYILYNEFTACFAASPNPSSQISLDEVSGLVRCDCGSGSLYGVTLGNLEYNRWIEIRHEIDLDADWCDVFYDGAQVPQASYSWSTAFPPGGSAALAAIELYPGGEFSGRLYYDDMTIVAADGGVGTPYCTSTSNSSGGPALISATGSPVVALEDLTLSASPVPADAPGVFFYGDQAAQFPFGSGFLCVGGGVSRLPVVFATGEVLSLEVPFDSAAAANTQAGLTIYYQAWFRDPLDPSAFQTSDGLAILHR